nr:unnamed protein product [Spirometra erinaceieuropaei]
MLLDACRDERPRDPRCLQDGRPTLQPPADALPVASMDFSSPTTAPSMPLPNGDMQRGMGIFAVACDNFNLVINTEKTVVMHQPPPDAVYVAPQINANGAQLQVEENFTYLGSTLSRNTKIDDEVAHRISKVYQEFGHLQNTVWNRQGLYLNTRVKMCKAVILPTLLYGVKIWTVYKKQPQRLNHFHFSCLPGGGTGSRTRKHWSRRESSASTPC